MRSGSYIIYDVSSVFDGSPGPFNADNSMPRRGSRGSSRGGDIHASWPVLWPVAIASAGVKRGVTSGRLADGCPTSRSPCSLSDTDSILTDQRSA